MSIEVVAYTDVDEVAWEALNAASINATLLHSRRFLSYHGNRFKDLSVMIKESGKLIGLFAAAQSPAQAGQVVSHPGITYGGVVHAGKLTGMKMIEALTAVVDFYRQAGYQSLQYKVLPYIYAQAPSQDDLYALFRLGARRTRCDLSCAMDLSNRLASSERRRRGLKKAQKAVTLSDDVGLLSPLWDVLAANLNRKHEARPVHSLAELQLLAERFPGQIAVRCAMVDGRVEAGVIFFNSPLVWHAQYIAASEKAYSVSALDAVFECAIAEAGNAGARYFDFGTSNEEGGAILNDGLYRFKSEFGASGVAHEFYELQL